jgi:hypothetical protein
LFRVVVAAPGQQVLQAVAVAAAVVRASLGRQVLQVVAAAVPGRPGQQEDKVGKERKERPDRQARLAVQEQLDLQGVRAHKASREQLD